MLSVAELHSALTDVGARAFAQGKTVELAIYGGSALMLASNFRVASEDVDAVAALDQGLVGIVDKAQLQSFAEMFYPEARVSGRVRLGIETIWTERKKLRPGGGDAPSYPGRRGPSP